MSFVIANVEIIEPAVYDKEIKIDEKFLLVEPVDNLDDLLFWEQRLEQLDKDYVIAAFDTTIYTRSSCEKAFKRVYGIFTQPDSLKGGNYGTK